MIHELKINPRYFDEIIKGEKTFEVRKDDRSYEKGDFLALNEHNGEKYTGNSCLVYVDYILRDGDFCKTDYVIMAIKPCNVYAQALPKNYRVPLINNNFREED